MMDKKTKAALVASAASLEEARAAATKLWTGYADPTEAERFESRVADVGDVESAAAELLETLAPLRDIDGVVLGEAKALVDALNNAGSCEKESDLDANLTDAMQIATDLRTAIMAVRKFLKEADDDQLPGEDEKAAAEEAIGEALGDLRQLVSDLKSI